MRQMMCSWEERMPTISGMNMLGCGSGRETVDIDSPDAGAHTQAYPSVTRHNAESNTHIRNRRRTPRRHTQAISNHKLAHACTHSPRHNDASPTHDGVGGEDDAQLCVVDGQLLLHRHTHGGHGIIQEVCGAEGDAVWVGAGRMQEKN